VAYRHQQFTFNFWHWNDFILLRWYRQNTLLCEWQSEIIRYCTSVFSERTLIVLFLGVETRILQYNFYYVSRHDCIWATWILISRIHFFTVWLIPGVHLVLYLYAAVLWITQLLYNPALSNRCIGRVSNFRIKIFRWIWKRMNQTAVSSEFRLFSGTKTLGIPRCFVSRNKNLLFWRSNSTLKVTLCPQ
jgi:hypothetical protein